nr:site-specific integrase [Streptomyces sp. NBC_00830]
MVISNASRANEVLGIRCADVDWGDQVVRVRRKGTDAEQWLPASAEAFVWLRLYLDAVGTLQPSDPIWWTLRRRRQGTAELARQPLGYDALRAVLRRANEVLGTNWTMHPEGRWAGAPALLSAMTCSTTAWWRCSCSAWSVWAGLSVKKGW